MCTNFLLSAPAGSASGDGKLYVTARCLELAETLNSSLYLVPRGQNFPLGKPPDGGISWTNIYGFVGLGNGDGFAGIRGADGTEPKLVFMDGINEKGLSCAALWLPGTEYPSRKSPQPPILNYTEFVAWVLGLFANVGDLVETLCGAMPTVTPVQVVGPPQSDTDGYLPLHFIATDASGQSVVVEFIAGAMQVYGPNYDSGATDDAVLTNAPPYPWQRANLANYANLNPVGPATSLKPNQTAVGSTLLGLPGDPMSASRFVKAATFRQGFGLLPADGGGWLPAPPQPQGGTGDGYADPVQVMVNVAAQMVTMIQATPYGTTLQPGADGNPQPRIGDWTIWWVVRDHTNRAFYYASAFNTLLQKLDLMQLDFDRGPAFASIPVVPPPAGNVWYQPASFLGPPRDTRAAGECRRAPGPAHPVPDYWR